MIWSGQMRPRVFKAYMWRKKFSGTEWNRQDYRKLKDQNSHSRSNWPKCHHPDFKKFTGVVENGLPGFFFFLNPGKHIPCDKSVIATLHESRLKWRLRGGWESVFPKDSLMVLWVKGNYLDLPDGCFVSPWLPASCNPNEPICLTCSWSSLLLSPCTHPSCPPLPGGVCVLCQCICCVLEHLYIEFISFRCSVSLLYF